MTRLLTAGQMKAIEGAAIDSGAVTGLQLMECAGQGVVDAILEEWPELGKIGVSNASGQKAKGSFGAVVLCGPGNNGGDGLVVARLLKAQGWTVKVFLFGDPDKLPPDARVNYEKWRQLGPVGDLTAKDALGGIAEPDLIIDAIFGTGLVRRIEGVLAQVLQSLDALILRKAVRVVAIDTPSGLCADSGKSLGTYSGADLTVAFHSAKRGHYLNCGAEKSGRLLVKPIGLDEIWNERAEGPIVELAQGVPQSVGKTTQTHKYSYGHALILSGGAGKTGAARLAARGALRIGAGLVTLGVPPAAQMEVASQVTAIMLKRVEGADHLSEVLQDERLNAVCLGPGLGVERARDLVPATLQAKRATVLDADALTPFADDPSVLFTNLHENCVLTPHAGEFARLFPDIAEKLTAMPEKGPAFSKVDATQEAAMRAGCVILFKGPDTVIAAPDGQCAINAALYARTAPWLATAGAGDVLAGFVTGLLARGLTPMQAAGVAAWLHVECARIFGPGLIAEDLPEQLPLVLKSLNF
ncbi:bifunctional ADP-dependent NAD(P)H-hydrate dehydratase/NAD(P)H-hydrate epimerase [Ruegeria profundi]|uniref:Bifunctional NAD(P)H-hydrate repair enzyme n=1 Tax=Ruegeria profundi TaxID=1685378 RepID=A0A0X3U2V4_9RHOB|nr:bifunctional ADP-dependent NAD(P)H-hydrate dehydratase/NAD(P)H-hydrate epimerase [Ruegeria profundi]KUJ82142.1 bifunctional ADP-dependent (S)-NAD(P)H-hydrate dehydratase/NAD(P)H-hydrate epimerase [Ruegeria profundi]